MPACGYLRAVFVAHLPRTAHHVHLPVPNWLRRNTCETNQDDCGSGPCQNGGTCNDAANAYQCSCAAGFAGDECTDVASATGGTSVPTPTPLSGPPPPAAGAACFNTYDVGTNSCASLLTSGYTCSAYFCVEDTCPYRRMCDMSCDFCDVPDPPPPPPPPPSRGTGTASRGGTTASVSTQAIILGSIKRWDIFDIF